MASTFEHRPVMVEEVVDLLAPKAGGVYVDCTVGGGGHTRAILEAAGGECTVVGLDRDPEALAAARERLAAYGERVLLIRENFRNLRRALDAFRVERVDGVVMDLGVSSHQLDTEERGFSYWGEGPLDMRLGPDAPTTAEALLETASAEELARILGEYGEERWAKQIARRIVERRAARPLRTAADLVEAIKEAVPAKARARGPHPARRTFQALRIAVNDELGALDEALGAAVERLHAGGRLVVISFHSLEDRIVKRRFAEESRGCVCPPQLAACGCGRRPRLKVMTKKPVVPSVREREENPRSRSAKLRAAERVLDKKEIE